MMKLYPLVDDLIQPVLRVAMPRAARLYAPGGTVHVVARCNNREFSLTTPEDFEVLLARLDQVAGRCRKWQRPPKTEAICKTEMF
jgi:REP element-mobilizing transposase RayT